MGCCGKARGIEGFAFLTGIDESFNHHPCHELERSREFVDEDPEAIRAHCFVDGMFMAHTKNATYAEESLRRVLELVDAGKPGEQEL